MNKNERQLLSPELLKTFVAIAESGNLTIAAGRLNRTQSAISVQLRKLETDFQVTLFNRTSKGMSLTSAGTKLLPKARSILIEIKQTGRLFNDELQGSIRVGIPDDFDDTMLEQILTEFAQKHPGVDVQAISGCTSKYPDAIRGGELDIAVYSGPNNDRGEILDTEKIVWAAKQGLLIDNEKPVPLAVLDRNCWWRNLPTDTLDSIGRGYKIAFRSSNFTSLRSAIRAGFAIGILPVSCVDKNMEELSKADGFPDLPSSTRTILIGTKTRDDLASAMAEAIKNAREIQAIA